MDNPTSAPAGAETAAPTNMLPWLAVALGAHTFWGMYPVIGRYLQTVSGLPSMSILVVGSVPLVLYGLLYSLPREGWHVLRGRPLQIMALLAIVRAITNILSMRYTLAIYVQLIGLMTPFIIALFNWLVLRDRMPRYTVPAMALSSCGALLMLSSQIGAGGIAFDLGAADLLGLALAFASTLALALYMFAVRRTATAGSQVSSINVLVVQTLAIGALSLLISVLTGEDWRAWTRLEATDWAVEASHVILVIILANGLQISALRRLGAPTVSAMMPWRLISTLTLAWLLLGERLTSIWQAVGALLVLATVTWYLQTQRA